jgi:hypothetical protein
MLKKKKTGNILVPFVVHRVLRVQKKSPNVRQRTTMFTKKKTGNTLVSFVVHRVLRFQKWSQSLRKKHNVYKEKKRQRLSALCVSKCSSYPKMVTKFTKETQCSQMKKNSYTSVPFAVHRVQYTLKKIPIFLSGFFL